MKNFYDYSKWNQWHWESSNRRYSIIIDQDLFGKWTVTKVWGGKFSKIHGYKKEYFNIDQISDLFEQINKKRFKRKYHLVHN